VVRTHPTMERESLIASAHKRRAMLHAATGQEKQVGRDLVDMRNAYEKALRTGQAERGADTYYPASNCLAAAVAAGASKGGKTKIDPNLLKIVKDGLKARNEGHKADFWSAVGDIEVAQYELMASRNLRGSKGGTALQARYQKLHDRVSSARKWDSVYDNQSLVLGRYADPSSAVSENERKAATELLETIRKIARPEQND
jgi:hypothetical protein